MSTIYDPPHLLPHLTPTLTDRKMKNGPLIVLRILSKPHFVLILHVECFFAKKNLVSVQSYVALVLFPRMSRRKLNRISPRFPFSFFCMRLVVTRTCFSKQLHQWQLATVWDCLSLAGLKVVTDAVSCGQGPSWFSCYSRENPHKKVS